MMAFLRDKVNKEKALNHYLPTKCDLCHEELSTWPHKTKDTYLLTMCDITSIKLESQYCKKCNVIMYNDTYCFGLLPVHNKVSLVSFLPKKI